MPFRIFLIMALMVCNSHASIYEEATAKERYISNLDWVKYSKSSNVSPHILYAIALKESGKLINDSFIPSPYAIGVGVDRSIGQMKHISIYPSSMEEAKAVLSQLLSTGHKNLGIGLMQISWLYHQDKVNTAFDLLDANTNLSVAARILRSCKNRNGKDLNTLSCYSYGEGDDPNGLIYANKAFDYADTYGKQFVSRLAPKGPPVGELNETYLASIWQNIEAQSQLAGNKGPQK